MTALGPASSGGGGRATAPMAEFLLAIRRRWRIVVAAVALGVGLATLLTAQATPTYQGTAQLFVSFASSSSDNSAESLSQGSEFAANRVTTYPELVASPRVLDPVIDELGLDTTAQDLAERVSASVPTDTVLIEVNAEADSAEESAEIANAVAENLITVVEDLDRVDSSGSSPVRVSITREAVAPESPESPLWAVNLAAGLVVGLGLGLALALLRETLDTTIKSETDVEEATGLRTLASVPVARGIGSAQQARDGASHTWSEAYRKLRTNISYLSPDDPPRTLMVTSTHEGDGKTVTAVHLATALAQGGRRTVLVDADLRRPSVHGVLELEPGVGVTSAVAGRADVGDLRQHAAGVDVITSGPLPPNPSEMLESQAFRSLVARLRREYDHVVIDTPPLLAVTDAAVVATVADTVLVVCRSGETKAPDLRRALGNLQAVDARVAGVVLNRVPAEASSAYAYGHRESDATG